MDPTLQGLFAEPLRDLGRDDARLRGIFTPESQWGAAKKGVSAQFLENAAEYHKRYDSVEWFRILIGRMIGPAPGARFILDIGSGSGNSVIPLLDLYPAAFVVATDISPQMLVILRDFLETKPRYRGRYGLVCMDAGNDPFNPGAFQMAVGAAVLHHIVDPRRVLAACASALAPGGVALFLEPFELGHGVLRIAYRRILAEAKHRKVRAAGFEMLQRMLVDHEARLRDKSDPIFDVLDDKWYFTRTFFENATAGAEWDECRVEAINGNLTPMVDQARVELRLGMGLDESALPPWAWEMIREQEASFSRDARTDLIFEGAVLLRRSSRAAPRPPGERRAGWWWNPAESGRGFFLDFGPGGARAACCAYDERGEPAWSLADAGALDLSGPAAVVRLALASSSVRLEPQHAGLPAGEGTGWWIEDDGAPATSIVVEALGNRAMAALLGRDGWALLIGERQGQGFEGDWLRFTGGQTLSGPYRAPRTPVPLGHGRLTWAGADCLVAVLPDGRRQLYRRLGDDETAPQNLRSTENCAS
ncbi:MAG TPA: methyltransferase [Usitatibacter sp.]|nr:methyltransferase [Usitatibacter sp.]